MREPLYSLCAYGFQEICMHTDSIKNEKHPFILDGNSNHGILNRHVVI